MQRPPRPSAPLLRTPPLGSGFTPLLLAALVFVIAALLTLGAFNSARHVARANLQNTFDYRARDARTALLRRMALYEEVLRGAQGYLRGSVDVSHKDFADYFALLKLDETFPGIEALGIATIIPPDQLARHQQAVRREGYARYTVHPPGPRPFYTSVSHIEPFGGRNLRAFGFDMFSEPVRRAAMEAARDSGQAAVTGKVVLVQEGGTDGKPGVLMYLPVYRAGMPTLSVAQRRAAIIGWVYSPFRMDDLMRGMLGEQSGELELRIYDGAQAAPEQLLYLSPRTIPGRRPMFQMTDVIQMRGRPWTVVVSSNPGLEAKRDTVRPLVIGLTGLGVGFLLGVVVWLLASERRRAVKLAQEMTLELRQSYARTEAEQRRMRVILQNAYDAFIAIDAKGRVTDWNIKATQLFGWTEREALGREIGELIVPPEQRARHLRGFQRFAGSGSGPVMSMPTEVTALRNDGSRVQVEVAVVALPTPEGYGASAFVRDITPRKQAEERERQRQQRLDETREALQRSQKLEAVGKLTGGVAHDFNNLLHIISANVQLVLRSPEKQHQRLQSILDAVARGSKLSAQLLAFARRQPLHPQVVDAGKLIERMDSLLHRAAGEGVELRHAVQPDLWDTLVDPNQLENVLLNLVINARDAMEGRGSITITLSNVTLGSDALPDPEMAPGQYVLVAVSDTGGGMPAEVMERAFEPFFTTKPEGKGTGLGLSMAHGFVKQSGGHIKLASEIGHGTTVCIYLPRCMEEVREQAAS